MGCEVIDKITGARGKILLEKVLRLFDEYEKDTHIIVAVIESLHRGLHSMPECAHLEKDAQEKLRIAREALERAHLLTCDETKIDERCFICEALEKTK